MWQAVHSCAQMQILRCKMLVGKSQTLSDLHRSGAGCAFFPNAIECVNAHSLRRRQRQMCIRDRTILRCKMLVGKSQTLSDLHRSGAGYAFLPNAFECVNTNSLQKSESLFGASVNGITPMFVVE